ncbi:MAG: DUF3488 domain-containing protein, partial [Deltaproteobacteria bacterium]|nr:DUF3488 domain-containing protein [Deltaproteobacteria bacterium]
GVQSTKLLLPKRSRDGWQLCAVSLLEFLVTASIADDLAFALFAFLFLVASAGAMWSLHEQEAEEAGRPAGGYAPSRGVAARVLLLVGIAGFLMTAVLFAVVPRLEFRRGLQRFSRAGAVSGFSDTVALREVTGLKADRRVVARVEFPFLDRAPDPGDLYLRGAVYSSYSNDGWRLLKSPVSAISRGGFLHLIGTDPRGSVIVADITLEAADHPRLFTYGDPFMIEGAFGPLLADTDGNLFLQQPGHPAMRYRLRFSKEPPRRAGAAAIPGRQYLEFPEGYEDVRALGIEVIGDARTDKVRADRILDFFRRDFRYTVSDPAPDLRRFLFGEKAGYCEHYAASLALLLRAVGIPSRVAVGYLGGEWNALGRYLIVRQSDAHAWVEAWIGGGWTTLDATPPQGEASPFYRKTGPLGLYSDWLRQRWDKYVMSYSLRMQADAVHAGWSGIRRTGRTLGFGRETRVAPMSRPVAAIVLLAAAALFLLLRKRRERKRGAGTEKSPRLPAPYGRLLRRLERSGFRPSPGAPMEEMVEAAVRTRPDLSEDASRFLTLYHRDRFGPAPLPPETRSEAFRSADRFRKRLSA